MLFTKVSEFIRHRDRSVADDFPQYHAFTELGVFVVNNKGKIQVVDISNNPFVRPELQALVNGLGWIRNPDNNYPVRGMHK